MANNGLSASCKRLPRRSNGRKLLLERRLRAAVTSGRDCGWRGGPFPVNPLVTDNSNADLRIRTLRGRMHGVRRQVHASPPAFRRAADALSGMQEACAKDHLLFQFAGEAEAAFRYGCKKGRIHGPETRQQRRIRKATKCRTSGPWTPTPVGCAYPATATKTLRLTTQFGFIRPACADAQGQQRSIESGR